MTLFCTPVDPFSESIMCMESDDYPKTDFSQFQFTGLVDPAAMTEAFAEAIERVPTFCCHLTEHRKNGRYIPYWEQPEGLVNRLIVEDCRPMVAEPFDPMEFATRYHANHMERRLDLAHEFPVRCHLVRIADDRWWFVIVYHHSAFDGGKAFALMNGLLTRYHELVTGRQPEWANLTGMTTLATAKPVTPQPFVSWLREQLPTIIGPSAKVDHIATRERRKVRGRHSVRGVIDDKKLLKAILARARRNEATLSDLMLAVMKKVVGQWNEQRNAPHSRTRMMLISNLRGRITLPEHAGAGVAALSLSGGEPRSADPDEACRQVRQWRVDQLRRGNDVALYRFASGLVQAARVLPMKVRRKILRPIMSAAHCTVSISNVGVVWPKIVDGRPTGETAITRVGDFEIDDMLSSPSIGKQLDLGIVCRTLHGRLLINFTTDRADFHFDEIQEFRNRFLKALTSAV